MLRMRLTKAQQLELCKHRKTCTRTGWLRHFQRRHGEIDSVDLVSARAEAERLRKVLADYNPSDVFNMDKAALFYQALPRRSLCVHAAPALKQRKAHVTMVVGTNATGSEKLPLLILVTAKRPRWLRDKPDGVDYKGSHKVPEEATPHVRVVKLPPNTTAAIQPMDQGVIATLKARVMDAKTEAIMQAYMHGEEDPHQIKLAQAL
ncbi:hypothetical protein PR002_g2330 [Phytophthora rubi]|uniref:DDE-1 domain-containing protein n=1 Tax=Phytophthora rubi TaxID=129364 RepID=A0A6A3NIA4_9STRA|nr:hypothetical protein PR002_g2330 [Phytophthora rubi]